MESQSNALATLPKSTSNNKKRQPCRALLKLPIELQLVIASHLDYPSDLYMMQTCRLYRSLLHDQVYPPSLRSTELNGALLRIQRFDFLEKACNFAHNRLTSMYTCWECLRLQPKSCFGGRDMSGGLRSLCLSCVPLSTWERGVGNIDPDTYEVKPRPGNGKLSPLERLPGEALSGILRHLGFGDKLALSNCSLTLYIWAKPAEAHLNAKIWKARQREVEAGNTDADGGILHVWPPPDPYEDRYSCYECFRMKPRRHFARRVTIDYHCKKVLPDLDTQWWLRKCTSCRRSHDPRNLGKKDIPMVDRSWCRVHNLGFRKGGQCPRKTWEPCKGFNKSVPIVVPQSSHGKTESQAPDVKTGSTAAKDGKTESRAVRGSRGAKKYLKEKLAGWWRRLSRK